MQMPKKVILITDGACIGNPGPGGWACILRYGEHKKELYGSEPKTTNNRMELKAVIAGLSALKEPCAVLVTTDSKYVKQGLTEWLERWKKRSWVRKVEGLPGTQPVKNRDLWEQLDALKSKHSITLEWVKGHADHPDNNRCDRLATKAARKQLSIESCAVPLRRGRS
jgi:ribonuclease HI